MILSSVSESNEEKQSSNKYISESLTKDLAIESLWTWPPDKVTPLSPRIVSYPLSNFNISESISDKQQLF